MSFQGLHYEREKEMDIFYRGENIGTRRADFFVEGCIMVELKAVIQMEDVHLAQAMNYLEAYKMEIGLLINFGARSLQFKRVHNNKLIQKSSHEKDWRVTMIEGLYNHGSRLIAVKKSR